uniref:Uncharacterized protein n=2 Tax=Guillardia theta TaxID=55529 RepID=A0A7S4U5Z9_GUITH|mmetsp:Transcript_41382/g.130235  ORF Transcript_41382/g.130235 Transcript_41382/m.130235 type:complete len:303 (+) Transcript_41382:78-986(+)
MPHAALRVLLRSPPSLLELLFFGPVDARTLDLLSSTTTQCLKRFLEKEIEIERKQIQSPIVVSILRFNLSHSPRLDLLDLWNILHVHWLDAIELEGWKVSSISMREGNSEAHKNEDRGALHLSSSALLQKACLPAAYEECILEEGEDKLETSVKQEVQEDSRASGLPLPKVVEQLVKEGTSLQWNSSSGTFVVVDGERFEERFKQLRKVRQKQKEGSRERPFSRMHNFYVLEFGDRWAKTGSIFRPKSPEFVPKIERWGDGESQPAKKHFNGTMQQHCQTMHDCGVQLLAELMLRSRKDQVQ